MRLLDILLRISDVTVIAGLLHKSELNTFNGDKIPRLLGSVVFEIWISKCRI